jgi:hypothetical protein
MARGAGLRSVRLVTTVAAFEEAFRDAAGAGEPACIVAKVEAVGPMLSQTEVHMLENRFEFARAMQATMA